MQSPQEKFLAESQKRRDKILRECAKGRTQEDVAKDFGITRQRVCQIIGAEKRRRKNGR
jgi:transcriptional regulator